jgi:hypothetical protein
MRAGCVIVGLALTSGGCGLVGPSCVDEDVTFMNVNGSVTAGASATYNVVSPKNSNLLMRLTWPDTAATLGLRATLTACGDHVGCRMDTFTPTFGPGGPSPIPQPWPAGLREMLVDGSKGKTYRVEITTESEREVSFTLQVTYQRHCES